ncbi:phosphoribosylglycinamide formyltransferase [Gallaecimonas pentaromativorans]|uniref:Phosphoribosylglycinamide formyltransferase n=1 Tax=Gallaecimonas pentaromativorans TaxID=584787 RepID=A0A3N1PT97_9GAMM|nr:phosphoribosylglycinamide formyltransferase [Gallaecimonas pentaromativorans]ROQ29960.1 phosphoribosylglycinamide formyltransferase-1 [Gallaecimonas pentaromativorans]
MKRLVVLISGSGSNLQAIIDACQAGTVNGQVVGVISNKASAYGLTRAENAGVPTRVLSHKDFGDRESYDAALVAAVSDFSADLVVLAGFMRILTPVFVSAFEGKLLNIHPSLLPKYKGLDTHQRALDAGDSEHGVSVHFVTAELDGGPVIAQAKVAIEAADNADSLAEKVHRQEHVIYPMVCAWFVDGRLQMGEGKAWLDGQVLPPCGYVTH